MQVVVVVAVVSDLRFYSSSRPLIYLFAAVRSICMVLLSELVVEQETRWAGVYFIISCSCLLVHRAPVYKCWEFAPIIIPMSFNGVFSLSSLHSYFPLSPAFQRRTVY